MDVKEATKRLEELRKEDQEVLNETYDDKLATAMNYAQALRSVSRSLMRNSKTTLPGTSRSPVLTCLLLQQTRREQNDCGTTTGGCLYATWVGC